MTQSLIRLREKMRNEQIDILLLPHNDRFNSEYLPEHEERLAWLSGFTGSWGFAIVTLEDALLFTDSRYTLQAPQQVDLNFWTVIQVTDDRPMQWLKNNLQAGENVAIEGWRLTLNGLNQWDKIVTAKKAQLIQRDDDIMADLWTGRPPLPSGPAFAHDVQYAGRSTDDKIKELQEFLEDNHLDGYLLSDPGHVCWLLNMRGRDIAHMPVILSMAFVAADGQVILFADDGKIPDDLKALWGSRVHHHDFTTMQNVLIDHKAQQIGVDGDHCPVILISTLKNSGKDLHYIVNPLELSRALKNDAEIAGSRAAHKRDAIAVMGTLRWLQTHDAPTTLSELDVVAYLGAQRAAQDLYVEDSFSTIAGSGAHGAIVHYHVTAETNQTLPNNTLFLLDSGGQYRDGTTDITRTIAIGTPTAQMIADYTSVMQGHIALSVARFPVGVTGAALDVLARAPLWHMGRNYTHGTGHGIGSFMGTHEGPQGFSPKSPVALQEGMLITNEPGYYKTDHYGIRLENVVVVIDVTTEQDDQKMLGFTSLTLVPFESGLLDFSRLTQAEKNWLRDYHAQVLEQMIPLLNAELQTWLQHKVAPFLAS